MENDKHSQSTNFSSARAQLLDMIWGFTKSQLVYVAAKLQIADLLQDGPKDAQALAHAVEINPRILYRILRGLAWCGVVNHLEDDRFSLTPMGKCLQSDTPNSLYNAALNIGEHWQAWDKLFESLKSDETAFKLAFGMENFEYYAKNEEAGSRFDRIMNELTVAMTPHIVNAYDFSVFKTIVDIGGGDGTLMKALLNANPDMREVIFDLPQVTERTSERLPDSGIADRCETV